MKRIKLLTLLSDLFIENNKIQYINYGGCGVFAEKLYDVLCSLGLNPKLIVITDNRKGMNERIKGYDKWSFKYGYASITHIVVKVGKYYIDSTGIYNSVGFVCEYHQYRETQRQVSTRLTIDTLRNWNAKAYIWNDRFNRRHIKTIEKKLAECYKKVEQSLVVTK